MMNRIFKRPMFRMGGRSDDGIMSLRPGFQQGGSLFERSMFKAGQAYKSLRDKIFRILLLSFSRRFNLIKDS